MLVDFAVFLKLRSLLITSKAQQIYYLFQYLINYDKLPKHFTSAVRKMFYLFHNWTKNKRQKLQKKNMFFWYLLNLLKIAYHQYKTIYMLNVHLEMCLEIKDPIVAKCSENIYDVLKTGQNAINVKINMVLLENFWNLIQL